MKKLGLDPKKFVKLEMENLDDLWYLSQIVDIGDVVTGTTTRKIKIGEDGDRNIKVVKKKINLSIKLEKVEFHKYSDILRFSGKIIAGPDDVPRGSYHTISVEVGTKIKIEKEFLGYQLDKIYEATKQKTSKILICTFDREEAVFAMLGRQGYNIISEIKGNVQKKEFESSQSNTEKSFFSKLADMIEEYRNKYSPSNIIIASPAFWKDELLKEIKNKKGDTKGLISATCSSVGKSGIEEVLKRPEISVALKNERLSDEISLVEKLLVEIKKDGNYVYGLKDTTDAAQNAAIATLLITDTTIHKAREENNFEALEKLMKLVDASRGKIHIIDGDNEAGKKLDGIGGIGAILRYKLTT